MALFNSKAEEKDLHDDLQQEETKASKEAISSILSKEMHITGDIQFKGKTRIDGLIDGNVNGEYLVLSETGKIVGDVTVDSLVCHGTIDGNINSKLVSAHATATIHGMLVAANLTVESGASLTGEIKASRNQAPRPVKPAASPGKAFATKPATKEPSKGDGKK
ncbi:MAG: polymer-forming cytoskeletal protein [Desulfobulbaceae bacterium]|nr:polymer-forming cytoskeletal protein [Desulfobulbaceae bacterium]